MPDVKSEDLRHISKKQLREITGYSYQALQKWYKEFGNEFLNDDDTIDFIKLFRYREKKNKHSAGEDKAALELEKLRKEIEFKDSQIQKNLNNMIERSFHEQVLASRGSSLRTFLETTGLNNLYMYVGKTLDQMRIIYLKLIKDAMREWSGGEID